MSGKVQLAGGQPLQGGVLILRPENGVHGSTATIANDGSFTLGNQSGAKEVVPGKYQVYVRVNDAKLQTKVPQKYQNSEDADSGLYVDIQDSKSDLVIVLK